MNAAVRLAACLIVLCCAAALLRIVDLDNRPMHCDEAVHAIKFGQLLEAGRYVYDPHEYHGPSLNYLTLPTAWITSAETLEETTETQLRLVPALSGIVLVGMFWLIRHQLGPGVTAWCGLLTAVSPVMVFFSRYYIQEMLLVFFTLSAQVALLRSRSAGARGDPQLQSPAYADRQHNSRGLFWLAALGVSIGMMHATKETCVIAWFAMAVAAACTLPRSGRPATIRPALAALIVLATAAAVSSLWYSSLLGNPQGVVDSFTSYAHYLDRGAGQGSAGSHVQPWYYYLQMWLWWDRGNSPVWTEGSLVGLALLGAVAAATGWGIESHQLPAIRFFVIDTAVMTAVYSALPYKTPWCILGLTQGMIVVAGAGASVAMQAAKRRSAKAVVGILLAVATGHLAWQAWRASFPACADPGNPYVYAHTTYDVPALADRVRRLVSGQRVGRSVPVQVICADDDYWPLPWYLRGVPRVGWYSNVPQGPAAPIIVAGPGREADLLEHLYTRQPPGRRHLYVPLVPGDGQEAWYLRPHVPLRLYVQWDWWQENLASR